MEKKINYIGIVAAITAFISLTLPWWTMTESEEAMGIETSADVSVYPYKATAEAAGWIQPVNMDLWFGWVALVLIVEAGIAGIVGSVIVGKIGKMILIVAGILALLSIIIFPAGIQSNLSVGPPVPEAGAFWKELGLFSSGSGSFMGMSFSYSSYLTFGFWLALAAAIIAFISSLKHPVAPPPAPPAAPTPPTPAPAVPPEPSQAKIHYVYC